MQKSLEDYEQFVADEAEQECAELEKMAAATAAMSIDDEEAEEGDEIVEE